MIIIAAIIDNFTKDELEQIVKESHSYKEVISKLGYSTNCGANNVTLKNRLEKYNIDITHFSSQPKQSKIKRNKENVFCENSTATQRTLRRWFVKGNYIDYRCSECGLEGFWNGKELKLQLDHINGDNKDNRIENLRWLCPNCHSQTETFCGKHLKKKVDKPIIINTTSVIDITKEEKSSKKKNYCIDCGVEISLGADRCVSCCNLNRRKVKRPSKEELLEKLIELGGNFTEAGRHYNVTDNAVRKWCKSYNLSAKSNDYKNNFKK